MRSAHPLASGTTSPTARAISHASTGSPARECRALTPTGGHPHAGDAPSPCLAHPVSASTPLCWAHPARGWGVGVGGRSSRAQPRAEVLAPAPLPLPSASNHPRARWPDHRRDRQDRPGLTPAQQDLRACCPSSESSPPQGESVVLRIEPRRVGLTRAVGEFGDRPGAWLTRAEGPSCRRLSRHPFGVHPRAEGPVGGMGVDHRSRVHPRARRDSPYLQGVFERREGSPARGGTARGSTGGARQSGSPTRARRDRLHPHAPRLHPGFTHARRDHLLAVEPATVMGFTHARAEGPLR